MRLISCQIVNFGCLSNCSFSFDDGLNLLYAENGRGKSTFAAFLKAMLYGLPSVRKGGAENERRRYTPWQGGTFGGSLSFEAEGTEYRLERFFGAKEREDRFALYHLATGNPSTRYTENIGEELFGVDADGFERTLYISQTAPFLPPDNNSIRARLGELIEASDDLGSFEKADDLLDTARRYYYVKGDRGHIADLTAALREKEAEIAAAKDASETALRLAEELTDIAAKREEIAQALKEAQELRAAAERRRLWDEQNASYHALLDSREAAKRQLTPLEEFFAPHLPTDEELFTVENAETECTTLAARISGAVLSEEDVASLADFRARYGEYAPTGAFMEKMHTACDALRSAREALRATEAQLENEKDPLHLIFDAHVPTDAEQAAIRTLQASLEATQAELFGDRPEKKSSLPVLPLLWGGFGVLALLAVLGFIFSLFPIAIVATVMAVGVFALAILRTLNKGTVSGAFEKRLEEYRLEQKRLAAMLIHFGYTAKDPLLSASHFFSDLERYFRLTEEEARTREKLAALRDEVSQKHYALCAILGITAETDPEAEARRIESEVPVFRLLLQKQDELARRRATLTAERERCERIVSVFLAHYPSLVGLSPRVALDTVKQNMLLSRQAMAAYTAARNRVANHLQNTRFDPDAPPPPVNGDMRELAENERTLQNALTELESLASVKANERARLEEIALTIPLKEAERDRLIAEKAEAEHTLALIGRTKTILEEAKNDLSTRYLRDMELHFDRYYKKLREGVSAELPVDNARTSPFSMDTSLAVSCESYGERRPVSVLSRGERDLVAFSARLALLESIFKKEAPVLLLDDPFINLDDGNFEKATDLLASLAERFQIIYTVCSTKRLPADLPLKTL